MKMKVCLVILAVMVVMMNTQIVEEEMFSSNEMWGSEMATAPKVNSEEEVLIKSFLGEEDVKPSGADPAPAGPSSFDNIVSAFSKMTNQWSKIVDAFKTTRSSVIKERLIGKGFESFNQSAQIQISKGVKGQYFDQYTSHLQKRLKVPEERKEDLEMILEECKWAEAQVWTAMNTLFSVDEGGNTKFASILISRNDEKDTFDFVFTDITAAFKLAPDVLVVTKSLSVLGGIWSDTKDVYEKVPRNLTPEDIQVVLSFFQIVAFKGFAEQFGIKLEFPKF